MKLHVGCVDRADRLVMRRRRLGGDCGNGRSAGAKPSRAPMPRGRTASTAGGLGVCRTPISIAGWSRSRLDVRPCPILPGLTRLEFVDPFERSAPALAQCPREHQTNSANGLGTSTQTRCRARLRSRPDLRAVGAPTSPATRRSSRPFECQPAKLTQLFWRSVKIACRSSCSRSRRFRLRRCSSREVEDLRCDCRRGPAHRCDGSSFLSIPLRALSLIEITERLSESQPK